MEHDSFFAPKVWDFAYPNGHAPPPTSPVLKAIDKPCFMHSETPSTVSSRRESDSSSSSSSSSCSETNPSTANQPRGLTSMPAWARNLPKEVFGGQKDGFVLFPTRSVPRVNERRGGIRRPGHPVLKLEIGERDRV
ncbi:uncharacterized protein LY89DRAFT_729824 [Mollisia scopiformis]|uniref:Uncharacterized protein n=1 Tax=Mollisia scopiformis TaxID=149040 RepID=A0A194XMM3_MOLSC|nr:uncharacterized protein LY89DRAFT_729824 [Mollisia scopiformis]KUJ21022.1 hypothetical protein LY89DRAFT_729824 [Mollisia scopiformis]